ncbi:MAG: WD40 repeat domain-containing protein [Candidatus Andersenbacteria bacterium]
MNRLIRRILLLASFLAFIAIAPAIVLYAVGYRPPVSGIIVPDPVGVLLLDAFPKRAQVTVNDSTASRVPGAVSNLAPGNVRVHIFKDGYVSWEKNLPIEPARATEARDVRLFPQTPDTEIVLRNVEDFSLAPNRSLIAAVSSDNTLQIMRQNEESLVTPITLPARPLHILWSPDSTLLLLTYPNRIPSIVDVTDKRGQVVPLPELAKATNVQWDPRVPGRLLFLLPDHVLMAMSISSGTSTRLGSDITSFALSSKNIYALTTKGEFNRYNLQGQFIRRIQTVQDPVKTIAVTPAGAIALHFEDSRVVVLNEDQQLQEIVSTAQKISWSPDGRMLMMQTAGNELHVYNVANERRPDILVNQMRLIVRLSRPISDPQWFAGGNHLIYQVDDQIIISEIDTRDYPATYTLDSTNTGSARISVGEEGHGVFYLKRDATSQSLVFSHLLIASDRT